MQIQNSTSRLLIVFSGLCCSNIFAADFERLLIPDDLVIALDPLRTDAVVSFNISNVAAKPSNLDLKLARFEGTSTHLPPHGATYELFLHGVTSRDKQPLVLKPNEYVAADVKITGLVEVGDYSLTLFNGPVALGKIQIVGIPFKLRTDSPDGTAMPVVAGPDSLRFAVRNDDKVASPVKWELSFGTGKVQGSATLHPADKTEITCSKPALKPDSNKPAAAVSGSCVWKDPEDSWDRICRGLRDSTYDGRLRITFDPQGKPESLSQSAALTPTASFPIKVYLRDYPTELTTIVGSVVLVLFLTLGAIASLIANLWIPHNLQKNSLQTRLSRAIRRIGKLSTGLASRGRISAEVDCSQIVRRLKNEGAFYSDFDVVLRDYEAQVSAIECRIALMNQVDVCQRVLDGITATAVPPSLITQAREPLDHLNQLFDGSEWNDAQLRVAGALAADLERSVAHLSQMKSSGTIDSDVQTTIISELKRQREFFSILDWNQKAVRGCRAWHLRVSRLYPSGRNAGDPDRVGAPGFCALEIAHDRQVRKGL